MSTVREQSAGPNGPLSYAVGAVILDIEGTLGPISFVKDVLFPYSRERLAPFVQQHRDDAVVANILADAATLDGHDDPVSALLRWHDADRKIAPLKSLQGLIWEEGYRTGAFSSPLYPDAVAALRRWSADGLPLYIYSSGSVAAQILFFKYSVDGDLTGLFRGHFDTVTGPKTAEASYQAIARKIQTPSSDIAFFSDQVAELDAARNAGLLTIHVAKDGMRHEASHASISDFSTIKLALRTGLKPQARLTGS